MAKRRAEPLLCHVPIKRLLREPPSPRAAAPERRPRGEAAGAGPAAPKRKLEEAEAPPGKRPGLRGSSPRGEQGDVGGRRRRRSGPAAPQDEGTVEGRTGGCGKERAAAVEQEEEFCQYNSFLYWRAPLPTIDLSDIQNLDGETPPEAKTPSRTDTMDTEMET
uniref:Putative WW-binding domain-containing protein n=1 Tax=Calidris pygmaea TaxID=425635 RepID=A0A8C3JFI2_9CHAR